MRPTFSPWHAAVSLFCILAAVTAANSSRAQGASEPSVTVVATDPTAAIDGSSTGLLTFFRTGDNGSALTVNFALGGTAAKWTDYYRLPEGDMPVAVTIPAGASSATLAITAKGNSTGANPETAVFTLLADPSYSAGTASTATITIVAGAPALPSVTVAATDPTAAIDGSSTGLLTFSRTGDTGAALTVNFALGGTAVKWTDYYRLPEGDMPVAVTIPAGASSATLAITAKGNTTGANPETAVFSLSADSSYSAGTASTATITIVAGAPALPSVTVVATDPTAAIDGSSTGLLTFFRTGDNGSALTVNFALGGTAAKWTDYYRLPEGDMPVAVTIPAGAASATLAITAKANSTGANPETAVFTLLADPSYSVGACEHRRPQYRLRRIHAHLTRPTRGVDTSHRIHKYVNRPHRPSRDVDASCCLHNYVDRPHRPSRGQRYGRHQPDRACGRRQCASRAHSDVAGTSADQHKGARSRCACQLEPG